MRQRERQELVRQALGWLTQNGVTFALNALGAVLILAVGGLVVKGLVATLRRALARSKRVDALLRTNDLRAVDDVKRVIIDLYEEDMHKISPSGVLSMLFDAIPAQLAKKSSRYHVSSVLAGPTEEVTRGEEVGATANWTS